MSKHRVTSMNRCTKWTVYCEQLLWPSTSSRASYGIIYTAHYVSNKSMYTVRNVWNWRSAGNTSSAGNSIHLAEWLSDDFIKSDIKLCRFPNNKDKSYMTFMYTRQQDWRADRNIKSGCYWLVWRVCMYVSFTRGADKTLARPGRKQATPTKLGI